MRKGGGRELRYAEIRLLTPPTRRVTSFPVTTLSHASHKILIHVLQLINRVSNLRALTSSVLLVL